MYIRDKLYNDCVNKTTFKCFDCKYERTYDEIIGELLSCVDASTPSCARCARKFNRTIVKCILTKGEAISDDDDGEITSKVKSSLIYEYDKRRYSVIFNTYQTLGLYNNGRVQFLQQYFRNVDDRSSFWCALYEQIKHFIHVIEVSARYISLYRSDGTIDYILYESNISVCKFFLDEIVDKLEGIYRFVRERRSDSIAPIDGKLPHTYMRSPFTLCTSFYRNDDSLYIFNHKSVDYEPIPYTLRENRRRIRSYRYALKHFI